MSNTTSPHAIRPPQHQDRQPGIESEMEPKPRSAARDYQAAGKLIARRALITGADSGIGRAVAVAYAKEGCDVAIQYLDEDNDARETQRLVVEQGRRCILLPGDIGDEGVCREAVASTVSALGGIDILIHNAAEQHMVEDPADISHAQVERTFRTNVFAAFHLVRHALPEMNEGSSIIVTSSIVAYRGSATLVDYAATKGALIAMMRSLSTALVGRGIRVNAVAPGPIWAPLIPSTFPDEKVAAFGSDVPMGRAGEPDEVAPAFVFLASADASYITGQTIHINGGVVING